MPPDPFAAAAKAMVPALTAATQTAATTAPPRIGYFYVPNGMHMPLWKPQTPGIGSGWKLSQTLSQLEPLRQYLTVMGNLNNYAAGLGDGGGPQSVAAPCNGQWIYLFRPVKGALEVERLVDLSKHDYQLEPNVTFTPDNRWIVFRSNMHGETHVYAVEVAKARQPQAAR